MRQLFGAKEPEASLIAHPEQWPQRIITSVTRSPTFVDGVQNEIGRSQLFSHNSNHAHGRLPLFLRIRE
jgi:hypothetical protein